MASPYPLPCRLEKRRAREGFDSGAAELDEWLVTCAWENQRVNNATTFVSTAGDTSRVAGYYAITIASIARAPAPPALSKGSPQQVGCLLLARVAVDQPFQGTGLGTAMLTDCLKRAASLSTRIALKALLVRCRDEAARDFCLSKAEFAPSSRTPDPRPPTPERAGSPTPLGNPPQSSMKDQD